MPGRSSPTRQARVVRHSYRQTLEGVYGNSTHLLVKALRNARDGMTVERSTAGRNYRLPSNETVARFVGKITIRRLQRMAYGVVMRKRWRVGRTDSIDPSRGPGVISLREPRDLPLPNGFTFAADPCPGADGTIWCEAMEAKSGKGQLVVMADGRAPVVVRIPQLRGHHCSYPFVVTDGARRYLVPEMSAAGPPRLFELDGTSVVGSRPLRGLEQLRIVDPTLYHHQGRWWLFAGLPGSATDLLWLWSSDDLLGLFTAHPDNPIVMDVARARPAGPLIVAGGRLFRPGQDNRGSYGDGVTIAEVTELTTDRYREDPRVEVTVRGRKGPHTLFLDGDSTVVDSYIETFDVLAWLGRVKNRVTR